MKTYFTTSSLRRSSPAWPDAYEIVEMVNRRAGESGVAQDRDAVQALLDEYGDADRIARLEISIEAEDVEVDE